MPAAALPFISAGIGAAGSASSAAGGKKAQKKSNELANQQMQLQQQQFGLAKQQLGAGNQTIAPATGYFNALLQGGQAARQAVGPYASLIGQAGQGTEKSILAGTPRGGEQNLALAQSKMATGDQIARLYQGLQPMAAQGLGQLGGLQLGSASAFNPNPNIGGAFGAYGQQQQNAGSAGAGFGNLLYNSIQKLGQGKGAPPSVPWGANGGGGWSGGGIGV